MGWRTRKRGSGRQRGTKFLVQDDPKVAARRQAIKMTRHGVKKLVYPKIAKITIVGEDGTKTSFNLALDDEPYMLAKFSYSSSEKPPLVELVKTALESAGELGYVKLSKKQGDSRYTIIVEGDGKSAHFPLVVEEKPYTIDKFDMPDKYSGKKLSDVRALAEFILENEAELGRVKT